MKVKQGEIVIWIFKKKRHINSHIIEKMSRALHCYGYLFRVIPESNGIMFSYFSFKPKTEIGFHRVILY